MNLLERKYIQNLNLDCVAWVDGDFEVVDSVGGGLMSMANDELTDYGDFVHRAV